MANPPYVMLAQRIAGLLPADLSRVFMTTTGSDANEAAFKLARWVNHLEGRPEKHKIISPAPELSRQYAGHHGRHRDVRAVVRWRTAAAGLPARRATVLLSLPLGCRSAQRPLLPARQLRPSKH